MYKLTYRTINPNGAPYFLTKEEEFPTRGAMNHRAEALEAQGCTIIKMEEAR